MEASVEYLDHKVDADGLDPTKEKVASILESKKPNNMEELRIFLGLETIMASLCLTCLIS